MLTDQTSVAVRIQHGDEATAGPALPGRFRIETCESDGPRRVEAERYVRARFRRTHGAVICTFMPTLLLLTRDDGALGGVAGCRTAGQEPLFLERYLERPIEDMIAQRSGMRAKRSQVVEAGNFACRDAQTARAFMSLLPRYLMERQHLWIAFTATVSIRRILRSLGAGCTELGRAYDACVRGGDDRWGSYYANDPRVMLGYLPLARRIAAFQEQRHAD